MDLSSILHTVTYKYFIIQFLQVSMQPDGITETTCACRNYNLPKLARFLRHRICVKLNNQHLEDKISSYFSFILHLSSNDIYVPFAHSEKVAYNS